MTGLQTCALPIYVDIAAEYLEVSLAIRRRLDDRWGIAHAMSTLAAIAQRRDDASAAHRLFAESLERFAQLGNQHGIADCIEGVAQVAVARHPERTARLAAAAARLRSTIGVSIPVARRAH